MESEKVRRIKTYVHQITIKPIKNCFKQDFYFFGLDTETYQTRDEFLNQQEVRRYSMQIYSPKFKRFMIIEDWSSLRIVNYLFSLCIKLKTRKLIFFAFNLQYDAVNLFPELFNLNFIKNRNVFKTLNFKVKLLYSNPCYLEISRKMGNKKQRYRLVFVDIAQFFQGSLEKVANAFNLPYKKLQKPSYLGERKPQTKEELEYFKKYAMQDAKICYHLGKLLIDFHKEYDIDFSRIPTFSRALLSARIFKKYFLKTPIKMPPPEVRRLALLSYWGGRTECFVYGYLPKIYYYDFNSFYPYALTQIKIPTSRYWKFTTRYEGVHGFYYCEFYIPKSKINPIPIKYKRLLFPYGKFRTFVTGYELEQALKNNCSVKILYGFVYLGESSNDLKEFVNHFYKLKKETTDKVKRHFYKDILNSLYGKFIQLNEERIDEGNQIWNAGGLFNPAIASWVTGYCRAKLFEIAKKHEEDVIYMDTDSLILKRPLKETELIGEDLGKLKLEYEGFGIFVREKCYKLENKFVHHGFLGTEEQFENCLELDKNEYYVKRILKFREALRRGYNPLVCIEECREFDLSSSGKRLLCFIPISKLIENKEYVELEPVCYPDDLLEIKDKKKLIKEAKRMMHEIKSYSPEYEYLNLDDGRVEWYDYPEYVVWNIED